MARFRSPNYPAISLSEVISRVKKIYEAERHLAAPKEVVAKHLGYNGLNGAAISAISAIGKYGLIEETSGNKIRVSPSAVTTRFSFGSSQRCNWFRHQRRQRSRLDSKSGLSKITSLKINDHESFHHP